MKKSKLVSLQSSGESFEKTIALYYYTLKDNSDFYEQYDVYAFYGHNLPKKEKNICACGTIGFYNKYYSKHKIFKYLNKENLIEHKKKILNYLIYNKKLTYRVSLKYNDNNQLYWNYIKNLPIEYLYPNHVKRIIEIASTKLNINLVSLYFEDNLLEILLNIKEGLDKYSIYTLEYNGKIGRYYLNYDNIKSFSHIFNMLNRKSVLSGNSAFLLEQILRRTSKTFLIGYRNHSHDLRKNRDYVLSKILKNSKSIIEPKIYKINQLFSEQNVDLSTESKANHVYAIAYYEFLKNYEFDLNFNDINEVWYEIK